MPGSVTFIESKDDTSATLSLTGQQHITTIVTRIIKGGNNDNNPFCCKLGGRDLAVVEKIASSVMPMAGILMSIFSMSESLIPGNTQGRGGGAEMEDMATVSL